MSDQLLNSLYLLGYCVAWVGLAIQTVKIWRDRQAQNFSVLYVAGLLGAKVFVLPRAVLSDYWVWWLQEGLSTALTVIFCVGILKYRKAKVLAK